MNAMLKAHLKQNQETIEREVIEYAREYGVSMEVARRDVMDAYIQGYYEESDDAQYI